jgi:hypothetical protein
MSKAGRMLRTNMALVIVGSKVGCEEFVRSDG